MTPVIDARDPVRPERHLDHPRLPFLEHDLHGPAALPVGSDDHEVRPGVEAGHAHAPVLGPEELAVDVDHELRRVRNLHLEARAAPVEPVGPWRFERAA